MSPFEAGFGYCFYMTDDVVADPEFKKVEQGCPRLPSPPGSLPEEDAKRDERGAGRDESLQ